MLPTINVMEQSVQADAVHMGMVGTAAQMALAVQVHQLIAQMWQKVLKNNN